VFEDRDLATSPDAVVSTARRPSFFSAVCCLTTTKFCGLRDVHIQRIPIRLQVRVSLELLSLTQLGAFAIGNKPKECPNR